MEYRVGDIVEFTYGAIVEFTYGAASAGSDGTRTILLLKKLEPKHWWRAELINDSNNYLGSNGEFCLDPETPIKLVWRQS